MNCADIFKKMRVNCLKFCASLLRRLSLYKKRALQKQSSLGFGIQKPQYARWGGYPNTNI